MSSVYGRTGVAEEPKLYHGGSEHHTGEDLFGKGTDVTRPGITSDTAVALLKMVDPLNNSLSRKVVSHIMFLNIIMVLRTTTRVEVAILSTSTETNQI